MREVRRCDDLERSLSQLPLFLPCLQLFLYLYPFDVSLISSAFPVWCNDVNDVSIVVDIGESTLPIICR